MTAPNRLPDEALHDLLDGSPSEEVVGTPLAAYLLALREDAATTSPQPTEALTEVLTEGLDPADLKAGGSLTESAGSGLLTWRLRSRVLARALVAKFAALGILTKAAAAGAAVTVAASGAGAAGVLPEPAQEVFDDAVGREVQEAPAESEQDGQPERGDQGESGADVSTPAGDTPAETPADVETPEPQSDQGVSDDATGSSDGEPGVDGGDVADDASDGRSSAGDNGRDTAGENRSDAAGENRSDTAGDNRPSDADGDIRGRAGEDTAGDNAVQPPTAGEADDRASERAPNRTEDGRSQTGASPGLPVDPPRGRDTATKSGDGDEEQPPGGIHMDTPRS